MYIPTDIIPENDISISPKRLYNIIKKLLDNEMDYYDDNEKFTKLLKSVKKNMLDRLKKRYTWQTIVLSEKVCEHIYGENSNKFGQICGARIDIHVNSDNKKYRCSMHIDNKHIPKARNIDINKKCKSLKKNGDPCKMEGKYKGYCIYHYDKNKIEKLQKEVLILNTEKICNISNEITRNSINIDSLYNIIEKLKSNNNLEVINSNKFIIDPLKNKESIDLNINTNIMKKVLNTEYYDHNYFNNIKQIYCSGHEDIIFNNYKINNTNNIYLENIYKKQHNFNNYFNFNNKTGTTINKCNIMILFSSSSNVACFHKIKILSDFHFIT